MLRIERRQRSPVTEPRCRQQKTRLPLALTCGRDPQNAQAQGLNLFQRLQLAHQRRNHITRVRRPPTRGAPNFFDSALAAFLQRSLIRDHRAREFLVKCRRQDPRISFAQAVQKPLPKSLLDLEGDMLGIPDLLLARWIEHLLRGLIQILRRRRDRECRDRDEDENENENELWRFHTFAESTLMMSDPPGQNQLELATPPASSK